MYLIRLVFLFLIDYVFINTLSAAMMAFQYKPILFCFQIKLYSLTFNKTDANAVF